AFAEICSCEHENGITAIFQQPKTQTPSSSASIGAKSMAQATKHLRDLLEKIKGDTERALALLPSVDRAGRMMNQFSLNYSEVGQLAPNHLARAHNTQGYLRFGFPIRGTKATVPS